MDKKTLGKLNRIELRVYEMLGVKLFRRVIILFERIKHRKDGKQNENYHPQSMSVTSLESFSGYLLYNTMFHIVSLVLVVVYFVITWSLQLSYLWIDILMYVVVVFDLYCIMLQRYIYLKMKFQISKAFTKRESRIQMALNNLSSFLEEKDNDEFLEEYNLIQKLFHSAASGNDCVLEANCTETLNRLAIVAERAEAISPRKVRVCVKNESLHQLLSSMTNQTNLFGRVERRVSKLQKFLKRAKTSNVSFGYSIVIEDPKCEEAFCRLFPIRTREKIEFTISLLLTAYQQKGLVKQ